MLTILLIVKVIESLIFFLSSYDLMVDILEGQHPLLVNNRYIEYSLNYSFY